MAGGVAHPYYPRDIVLPDYVPPAWSTAELFGVFGVAVGLIFTLSWLFARSCRHLSASERFTFSWWAVTGAIHMLMEGAFVAFPALISNTSKAFLLDAWKEYAISDSRYATRDTCIVSLEAVTAFIEGPACILILYAMAARKPFSNLLQFTVSLGQLYGAAVYFATSYLEGFPHSDPHPIYFWGYFVGMNAIWILVPFLILWRCWTRIISAEASTQAPSSRRSKRD
ncbi:unnamed protein product [Closterium sp. NIES-54]